MAIWNERIRSRRIEKGLTLAQIADNLGVTEATAQRYESGNIKSIPYEHMCVYGEILKCSPAYLMGWTNDINFSSDKNTSSNSVEIPVIGKVAAGIPINAIQEIIDTEEITQELASTGEFFGLQIKGDSMTPRICEGDVVIVKQQSDAESGDIVIVTVNGDEATCKRLRKYKEGIELIPNNPTYDPLYFSNDEIESKPVRILGKVIELRGKF